MLEEFSCLILVFQGIKFVSCLAWIHFKLSFTFLSEFMIAAILSIFGKVSAKLADYFLTSKNHSGKIKASLNCSLMFAAF